MLDRHDLPGDTHDASVAHLTHRHLQEGDVVLGDDAFASYLHLAMPLQAKAHAIMPAQHRRVVDFTPGRNYVPMSRNSSKASASKPRSQQVKILGPNDQLVRYFKPPNKPQWMTAGQWQSIPDSIVVREIRRKIARNGFRPITVTVATTLLDDHMYAADEIVELRLSRWLIETNLRHLKITLGMDHLKCKTLEGVRKERLVVLLVYNLIRLVMLTAATRQKSSPNRLSFADTLAWLTLAVVADDPGTPPRLKVNRLRTGRIEPKAIKRGGNSFPCMTHPYANYRWNSAPPMEIRHNFVPLGRGPFSYSLIAFFDRVQHHARSGVKGAAFIGSYITKDATKNRPNSRAGGQNTPIIRPYAELDRASYRLPPK
jgi:hypothetical protein